MTGYSEVIHLMSAQRSLCGMAPLSIGLNGVPIGHSLIVAIAIAIPLFVLPLWVVVTQKQAFFKAA
jgi:hypothetical protein